MGSEKTTATIQAVAITAMIAMLFYQSLWGFILFPIVWVIRTKQMEKEIEEKRRQELEEQFIHGMQTLNRGLQAGLSMENALIEVQREIQLLYGKEAEFAIWLKDMDHSLGLNMPIEQLFLEFAYETKLEDAISFAEVFAYGKRYGANWKRMIDTVIFRMKERYDTRKEIAVMVAEKQMEQRIMNLMPLGMLAFLQIAAGDYMKVLYHNWLGVICMSLCLAGYVAALMLSEKILKIKV